MWEITVGQGAGQRGPISRDFIARKRLPDGRLSSATLTATLPWNEGPNVDVREQEDRCRDLFWRFAKEIAAQADFPIRR